MIEYQIPNDYEAEQAVLGAVIHDNTKMIDILPIISPVSFYTPAHQYIFRAAIELNNLNNPIDEILLGDQLKSLNQLDEVGGYSYLATLVDCNPANNVVNYAKVVRKHYLLRQVISITSDACKKSSDPEINAFDILSDLDEKISTIRTNVTDDTKTVKDVFKSSVGMLEKISQNNDEIKGIPTGFRDIDELTGGLQLTDFVIIGARPSMGKTALALDLIRHSARCDFPGYDLFISLEMSMDQLGLRLLAQEGMVNTSKLRNGNLEQYDWDKMAMAINVLSDVPILINDSIYDMDGIVNLIKQKHKKYGLKRVVIDYLQLIRGDKKKPREQEIAGISRGFKLLAKDLNINIVALCQLSRELERRTDKRPIMSDLRESGALEQDADVIAFVYRDEQYNEDSEEKGIAEILFRKHRNGEVGKVKLLFTGKYTKFSNIQENTTY